jgi:apolipoprotein D and lipocalin family protein
MGKWYEIARYPHRFQEGCVGTTATYSLRDDNNVEVLNQCYKEKLGGERKEAKGKAWVVDPGTNAKLKVSFFWPFSGHYWIIDLGENYEYAVVGHPGRKYLWILSRTPEMDGQVYNSIRERLKAQSYDTEKLIRTPQIKTP